MTGDEPDAKAILPKPRSVQKANSYQFEGHDVSPTVVDFNADGIPDFLGGAEDGRFYYLKNSRTR